MSSAGPTLTLTGTYTVDPLAEVIEYWVDLLDLELSTRVAPYGQVFQQLLDPASALRRNQVGANVVALRWDDLIGVPSGAGNTRAGWGDIESRVAELAAALASFQHAVPCMVVVGPTDRESPIALRATTELQARLTGVANVWPQRAEDAIARYRVTRVHDPASDHFGHVPYTNEAFAALGTSVARWYAALVRSSIKVLALDGDQTLWSGVLAEDGADGVRIDGPYTVLQSALVEQHDAGRLLCLISKNEESDVRNLFESRAHMPLKWSHLVAHRVNWSPKPDNLRSIVSDLDLGLDSVVYLDDSPVECAQMRAVCPTVTTVRVPGDPTQLVSFADHLWLLDRWQATEEDQRRTQLYRDNAARAQLRRGTQSLQAFLDSLELHVDIVPASPTELARLAQLTQRTNQFNTSLIRCDEASLRRELEIPGVFHRLVRARDRFGDYGIVGQMRARAQDRRFELELFMLSCRALGRGIEHRMLAAAGAQAVSQGLDELAVLFRRGERNAPARHFLERICKVPLHGDEQWCRLPAQMAAELSFDASASDASDDTDAPIESGRSRSRATRPDIGTVYEQIAHTLTTGADIVRAMAGRVRPRPDLAIGLVAPAVGLEREIAAIWQEVLRVRPVGAHDRFQDLGGKSIHLVQVHRLLLERLKVEVPITALFQHATVASLAAHLANAADTGHVAAAQLRGAKMREARARAAERFGVSK